MTMMVAWPETCSVIAKAQLLHLRNRVTMPYAMSLLSLEMLAEYFHGDAQTLANWSLAQRFGWLFRRRGTADRDAEVDRRRGLDDSPGPIVGRKSVANICIVHLLGDHCCGYLARNKSR